MRYTIGDLTLLPRRQLLDGGEAVAIGRKALDILSVLAEADGALVTKDELMVAVWPGVIVEENAIQVHVAALRKALGQAAEALVTVRGLGYRLAARPEAAPVASAAAPRSVAVLPFANLTGEETYDYLGQGLAEELINTLAQTPDLRVPSRTSSFAYRGRDIDVREIARQLGVAAVLEGSVRAAGERLRVTAQLIDAASGFHLWSENFDRAMGDLLALQDDLAAAIAAALGAPLGVRRRPTENAEAMRLTLQGNSIAHHLTPDALAQSAALLRRAIALDPGFARAHEGLASTLLFGGVTGAMPRAVWGEARTAGEAALALDPLAAGAMATLGCLDGAQGAWRAARARFEAALAIDDGNAFIHETFAFYVLLPTGGHALAGAHAAKALALAPARALSHWIGAVCAGYRNDLGATARAIDLAVMLGLSEDFAPVNSLRAGVSLGRGDIGRALREMEAALPSFARADGGAVFKRVFAALAGRESAAAASAAMARFFAAHSANEEFWRDPMLAGWLVAFHALLGDLDAALHVLSTFAKRMGAGLPVSIPVLGYLWTPYTRSVREDRRFAALADALGFTGYWRDYGPPDGYQLHDGALAPVAA